MKCHDDPHTHLTSGCRLKRSVARRKTMGWPPNAIQPSETCRLVSAGWWDDKFLKWPCTFRRIGVQNHCFTSRWWAQLKQRAPKKLWTFQVHDRLQPVFLTFCFNLLSPWYSQHSSCFTTLHLPVIRPDHPWPASNRVTSTCSTEASSLGTLSRSFNLSRWEDSTWIRCHILILRPRFFLNNGLHLTVNLLNLTYVNDCEHGFGQNLTFLPGPWCNTSGQAAVRTAAACRSRFPLWPQRQEQREALQSAISIIFFFPLLVFSW